MRASGDFEQIERSPILEWLNTRWGMGAEGFSKHHFWRRQGARSLWIAPDGTTPPVGPRVETVGIQVSRRGPPNGKPTGIFLLKFGHLATQNVVVLTDEQAVRFLRREDQPMPAGAQAYGYCVIKGSMGVLGCGRSRDGVLISEVPKAWLYQH